MNPIRRATIREKGKAALKAGIIYWLGMSLLFLVFSLLNGSLLRPKDFLFVTGICLAGAILFGFAMSFFQPLMAPPSPPDGDDGDEELGVPARLIPPSPVLGAKAFQDLNEPTA